MTSCAPLWLSAVARLLSGADIDSPLFQLEELATFLRRARRVIVLLSSAQHSDVLRLLGDLSESFASFAVKGLSNRKDRKEKPPRSRRNRLLQTASVCYRIVTMFCIPQ